MSIEIEKVYFAASFSRQAELQVYADDLEAYGIEVTSQWIREPASAEQLKVDANIGVEGDTDTQIGYAETDLLDIHAADTLIAFTHESGKGPARGSRHVEFGYALAKGKQTIVIGPVENIFYNLATKRYDNFGDLLETL